MKLTKTPLVLIIAGFALLLASCGEPYVEDSARLDSFLSAINDTPRGTAEYETIQSQFSPDTTDNQSYADLATGDFWENTYFKEGEAPFSVSDRAAGNPDSRFADSSTITGTITNNLDITDDVTFVFVPSSDGSTRLLRAIFVDVASAGTVRSVVGASEAREDLILH